jgi:hypothetical protein
MVPYETITNLATVQSFEVIILVLFVNNIDITLKLYPTRLTHVGIHTCGNCARKLITLSKLIVVLPSLNTRIEGSQWTGRHRFLPELSFIILLFYNIIEYITLKFYKFLSVAQIKTIGYCILKLWKKLVI